MLNSAAYYVAYLLIVLTAATSLRAARRQREIHRLDIFALVAVLAAGRLGPQFSFFGKAIPLAIPYLLLRLVQHFRSVPATLRYFAAAMIPTGVLMLGLSPV